MQRYWYVFIGRVPIFNLEKMNSRENDISLFDKITSNYMKFNFIIFKIGSQKIVEYEFIN